MSEWGHWWERLPAGVRTQVDGYVLQDHFMQAVRTAWEAGRAGGLGLAHAQFLVGDRYRHFGDRIARTPDCPVDLESLTARAAGLPGRVVAVEAVWDGDTVHDWFVILLAVTADPPGEHSLATVYRDAALRSLGDTATGPEPSATVATRAGTALATHLGVPFHFASPDTPNDNAPRWQP
ncbi:hypothetical protein [Streptomyces sp. NPDC086989]|uniref:hypothetical protein n=1 Tax=Streptomyces sp. NPDC086989 TaxID=3365764 RepID=UPI00380D6683